MALNKEDLEAVNKQVAAAIAAALPDARADSDAGAKLDKMLGALDAFCGRMDAMEKRMDEEKEEKKKADSKKDDDMVAADDDEEDDKEKKAKKDSEDKEAKEKADAEEKEEKAKADAAKAENEGMRARLAALESSMPKTLTGAPADAPFASNQARADEAYVGFGKRAPPALMGEDVLPYRKRLISGLKEHSPRWKDVDVSAFADSAFAIVEDDVYRDAATAAKMPPDLKDDELRPMVKMDAAGRQITTFVGRRSFIHGLKRDPQYVKAFNFAQQTRTA